MGLDRIQSKTAKLFKIGHPGQVMKNADVYVWNLIFIFTLNASKN